MGLVKLLARTTEALYISTEEMGKVGRKSEGGIGTLMEKGVFEGVGFEACWACLRSWRMLGGRVGAESRPIQNQ